MPAGGPGRLRRSARAVLDNHVRRHRAARRRRWQRGGSRSRPRDLAGELHRHRPVRATRGRTAHPAAPSTRSACPVLVGAVVADPDDPTTVLNVGHRLGPASTAGRGSGESYVKQHPVPFGEYIPFRSLDPVRRAARPRSRATSSPGDEPGRAAARAGAGRRRDLLRGGLRRTRRATSSTPAAPSLLVVQTNNATYGRTGQPEQQLAMSRLRAVEHGRAVLVAATSGISAIIAAGRHGRAAAAGVHAAAYLGRPRARCATTDHRSPTGSAPVPEWVATAAVAGLRSAWPSRPGCDSRRAMDVRRPTREPTQEPVP